MNMPYFVRLVVLCGATYFLIHTALAALAYLCAGKAVRLAEQMKAETSARLLLAVRVLPMVLALLILFTFCIPSYLWLEPEATAEQVGLVCVLMAALGALAWIASLKRVMSALSGTAAYVRRCQHNGSEATLAGDSAPVLVVDEDAPVLAMAGVMHPQLVVSRCVVRDLSADQIDAALRHERAHQISRDNLKRLLMLLAPDVLPFVRGFRSLERNWSRFTEWAADDYATGGDSERALSLASALIAVARMKKKRSNAKLPVLAASLVDNDHDLSERVDRLLHAQPAPEKTLRSTLPYIGGAAACVAGTIAFLLIWPASLSVVHQMLERLVQ